MAKKTRRALDNVDIGGLNADLESGPHLGTESRDIETAFANHYCLSLGTCSAS